MAKALHVIIQLADEGKLAAGSLLGQFLPLPSN